MRRQLHRRVSPSLVVAIVAVVLAGAGSAVAARLITGKQIKNGTIQLVDLSPSAREQLSGARGPRGGVGPQGSQGPAGTPGSPQAEPWKALPFESGWQSYANGWEAAGYRKDLASGRVDLRGLVTFTAGSPPSQPAIATLPPGYRPQTRQIFLLSSGEPPGVGRLFIRADGVLEWNSGVTGETDYTSLSGISFWTD
jgi:hypothetical protein